jgi:chromosome segregation ATPase
MQRVYGLVDDELVHLLDEKAGEEKVSRAQWIRLAIESYLHRGGEQETVEAVNLRTEAENLRAEAVKLRTAFDEQGQEITHLKDTLAVKDGELDRLKPQVEQVPQMWEELRSLRSANSQIKKELEDLKSANAKLKDDLAKRRAEADQARLEADVFKVKLESHQSALRVKDDEVAFLRATVHQLSEKRALPPSEEEIRAKHWWQFWR